MNTLRHFTALTCLLSLLMIRGASADEGRKALVAFIWASDAPNEFHPNRTVDLNFVGDETAYCSFVIKGFQTTNDGRVDLHADCELLDPNGKVMLLEKDYAKSENTVGALQLFIQLDRSLDITFGPTDPLGLYSIRLVVTDRIARTSVETTQRIRLFKSKKTRDLFKQPIREAKQLDDLWQYYFDSHDKFAVHRIISVLPWRKEGHGIQIALGGATWWSLSSNACQHNDVYLICKDALGEADEKTKALLVELLAEVDKKKAEGNGDKSR